MCHKTSQLALMYLAIFAKTESAPACVLRMFGFTSLWIASKFEGDQVRGMAEAKVRMEKELGKSLNIVEKYLVENVLHWKLAFSPPCDFISVIMNDLHASGCISRTTMTEIEIKATQLSELLLLCKLLL